MEQLTRRGPESRVPPTPGSRRNGRTAAPTGITRDRARHRRPTAPEVPRDKRREDPPSGPTVGVGARISNDGDPGRALLADKNALETIMQMKTPASAAWTREGPVAVWVAHPLFVCGEVVHVIDDQRAAVEAGPTRVDEARVW
jgi:hypothetical protein